MNNYLDKSVFPGQQIYSNENIPSIINTQPMNNNYNNLNFEHSYIENILRMNKGKKITIYTSINLEDSKDKEFKGIIEQTCKDHLIISDPSNGKWYLIPIKYINFIVFDEQINYINF